MDESCGIDDLERFGDEPSGVRTYDVVLRFNDAGEFREWNEFCEGSLRDVEEANDACSS